MILRLLKWIGEKRPFFHIYGTDGSLYMGRWWIFGGSSLSRDEDATVADVDRHASWAWPRSRLDAWIGERAAARLHHIAREDRGRDLHDHPCSFISVVLGGWYLERLPKDQKQDPSLDATEYTMVMRGAGSVAFRRGTDRHTIVRVSPGGAWTLFLMGPKHVGRKWGFWTRFGFVVARDYEHNA